MATIPRDPLPDSTLALLAEGYRFIGNRCDRYGTDIFATRLMIRPAVCVRGRAAAEMFYHADRFTRQGAMPPTTVRLLQDLGSVQLLSGEAHLHRKRMFLDVTSPGTFSRLLEIAEGLWRARFAEWQVLDRVVLFREAEAVLLRAACAWTGVPLDSTGAERRTRELSAMINEAGSIGPAMWLAQLQRRSAERWAQGVIRDIRAGRSSAPPDAPVRVIAEHRDGQGQPLDEGTAAIELLNLLRPTVAVARFIAFAALALHEWPETRRFPEGDEAEQIWFAQEVRRFYPIFPFIGGRVRAPFDWQGHAFDRDQWVILDLYGTDHDPRLWERPDEFRPERFRNWTGDAYALVPQGGGEHASTHRCPGEWITIALVQQAARLLATAIRYDVPEQDLRVSLRTMPALPASGFVVRNVRPIAMA